MQQVSQTATARQILTSLLRTGSTQRMAFPPDFSMPMLFNPQFQNEFCSTIFYIYGLFWHCNNHAKIFHNNLIGSSLHKWLSIGFSSLCFKLMIIGSCINMYCEYVSSYVGTCMWFSLTWLEKSYWSEKLLLYLPSVLPVSYYVYWPSKKL